MNGKSPFTFRDDLTAILAASLTPTTLAAVIFDLDCEEQPDDRRRRIVNRVKSQLTKQLGGMVGDAKAREMIESQAAPRSEPAEASGAICPHCESVGLYVSEYSDEVAKPGSDCVCGSCGQEFVAALFYIGSAAKVTR